LLSCFVQFFLFCELFSYFALPCFLQQAASGASKWQAQQLGAAEERPAVLFADCRLAAGAKFQRMLSEFRHVVAAACASSVTLPEQQQNVDRLASDILVPSFAALGIARERRWAALACVVGPACNTLGARVAALVQVRSRRICVFLISLHDLNPSLLFSHS
jgi:hypothetical protein